MLQLAGWLHMEHAPVSKGICSREKPNRIYPVWCHDSSLCTHKQPETACACTQKCTTVSLVSTCSTTRPSALQRGAFQHSCSSLPSTASSAFSTARTRRTSMLQHLCATSACLSSSSGVLACPCSVHQTPEVESPDGIWHDRSDRKRHPPLIDCLKSQLQLQVMQNDFGFWAVALHNRHLERCMLFIKIRNRYCKSGGKPTLQGRCIASEDMHQVLHIRRQTEVKGHPTFISSAQGRRHWPVKRRSWGPWMVQGSNMAYGVATQVSAPSSGDPPSTPALPMLPTSFSSRYALLSSESRCQSLHDACMVWTELSKSNKAI